MPRNLLARLGAGGVPLVGADALRSCPIEAHRSAYLLTPYILADAAAMASHMRSCRQLDGHLLGALGLADAAVGFVAARLVTTALLCAAAIAVSIIGFT